MKNWFKINKSFLYVSSPMGLKTKKGNVLKCSNIMKSINMQVTCMQIPFRIDSADVQQKTLCPWRAMVYAASLEALNLTFWLGAHQTRYGNSPRPTGCLFMNPQVIICQHTSDTGADALYWVAAFRRGQSAPSLRCAAGRRRTSSLSPQPFQMSSHCLVKNKWSQSVEKIRRWMISPRSMLPLSRQTRACSKWMFY